MIKNNAIGTAALLAVLSLGSTSASAVDSFAVQGGRSTDDDVNRGTVAITWDWSKPLLKVSSDWHLGGFWEASLAQWNKSDAPAGKNEDITDLAFTPVFRLQPNSLTGPYAEAAIGFHLLSATQIGNKQLSTAFQFGDHLGFGYRFGAKQAFDLGYRFQHLSNASIKRPNPGNNFHEIRLQYHF